MRITVYELLGLIKDGKAPQMIEHDGDIYEYDGLFDYFDYRDSNYLFQYLFTTYQYPIDQEVTILDENYMWEDINQIDYDEPTESIVYFEGNNRHRMNTNKKDRDIYIAKINTLIQNQKYLKKILDDIKKGCIENETT